MWHKFTHLSGNVQLNVRQRYAFKVIIRNIILKKLVGSFDPVAYLIWLGQLSRLHGSTDHRPVGSMDPIEPFEPVGSFDMVASIDSDGQFDAAWVNPWTMIMNQLGQ